MSVCLKAIISNFELSNRKANQTQVEFVRDLSLQFNRWRMSTDVKTLDDLVNLILLEQYKNTQQENMTTYVAERDVRISSQAAVLADECKLIHRSHTNRFKGERTYSSVVPLHQAKRFSKGPTNIHNLSCNYG